LFYPNALINTWLPAFGFNRALKMQEGKIKEENIKELRKLSKLCYLCGVVPLFLGIVASFVDFVNKDFPHMLVGLFITIVGYAFVKVSMTIRNNLPFERDK